MRQLHYKIVIFAVCLVSLGCASAQKKEQQARLMLAQEVDRHLNQLKEKLTSVPCNQMPLKFDEFRQKVYEEIIK